ncbi:MAG: hypothetical protein QM762_21550 [Chryseolinea sp.]
MDFVELYTPLARIKVAKRPKTLRIAKDEYDLISEFIVASLKRRELTLSKLLEMGNALRGDRPSAPFNWLIIQVKNDLELKEVIQITIDEDRNQVMRLR